MLPTRQTPPFFAVSPFKLVVMSLSTLGFYQLYWFYKNWQRIRLYEASTIAPSARTLLAIIFCPACFQRIAQRGASLGLPKLHWGLLAGLWIILNMASYLPNLWGWLALVACAPLVPVQIYANRINQTLTMNYEPNARFSALNWTAMVLVGGLMVLSVVALLIAH
jgi:hypothetical protein